MAVTALRLTRTLNPNFLDVLKKCSVPRQIQVINIHTSKKTKDPITLVCEEPGKKSEPVSYRTPEKWVSFGFSYDNISEDSTYCHLFFFLSITVCIVGWGFSIMYNPDNRMVDWVHREAYLELRRREAEGLPLINKDLIPLEKIELPTDEELGDAEIII